MKRTLEDESYFSKKSKSKISNLRFKFSDPKILNLRSQIQNSMFDVECSMFDDESLPFGIHPLSHRIRH